MRLLVMILAASTMVSAGAQNVSERYLLAAANSDRAAHGLPVLKVDEQLALAARGHAYAMAERGAISHQFPGEADLARRGGDAGAHFSLITENVAEASNAAKIHEMWMDSAGHRANLLDSKVNAVGLAVIQKNGQLYAVEDFSRTVEPLSVEEQETSVGRLLVAAGLRLREGRGDARQTCAMSTGYAGDRQPWFVMRYTASSLDTLPAELGSRLISGKYHEAVVGACTTGKQGPFTSYNIAVLLYP